MSLRIPITRGLAENPFLTAYFVVSYCRVLCETVKDFITRAVEISESQGDEELNKKCLIIREKLDQLLSTLHEEVLELVSSFLKIVLKECYIEKLYCSSFSYSIIKLRS